MRGIMKRAIIFLVLICLVFLFNTQAQAKKDGLDIIWIGHSCFEINYHDYRILIDPFTPEWFDYAFPQGQYDIVLASHKAQDHSYFDGIKADLFLLASGDKDEFIHDGPSKKTNIKGKIHQNIGDRAFSFWTVDSYHDDQKGAKEGVNGILCLDFEGIKVVHLGDLGHVLEEVQLRQIGPVDVLMIPVDGYFTIDIDTAKKIINQLDPKIIFPMHYKTEKSRRIKSFPVYTEQDLNNGFKEVKRLHQSQLRIDTEILDQRQQIVILDYLER